MASREGRDKVVRESDANKTQFQGSLQASCSINIKVDSIDDFF